MHSIFKGLLARILMAASVGTLVAMTARTAQAASCPTNFYRCALNNGGRVDPAHPGCRWNLRTDCPAHFYKCSLNQRGKVDSKHPGCCWDLTR
jgi:hypothetical protein